MYLIILILLFVSTIYSSRYTIVAIECRTIEFSGICLDDNNQNYFSWKNMCKSNGLIYLIPTDPNYVGMVTTGSDLNFITDMNGNQLANLIGITSPLEINGTFSIEIINVTNFQMRIYTADLSVSLIESNNNIIYLLSESGSGIGSIQMTFDVCNDKNPLVFNFDDNVPEFDKYIIMQLFLYLVVPNEIINYGCVSNLIFWNSGVGIFIMILIGVVSLILIAAIIFFIRRYCYQKSNNGYMQIS